MFRKKLIIFNEKYYGKSISKHYQNELSNIRELVLELGSLEV
jgi:hypothetical protein